MFVSWLAAAGACLLCIPVAVFLVEVVAAVASRPQRPRGKSNVRPRVAVVVPAHNEGGNIIPTLSDIRAQLHDADRLVVVADNCSDDTAAVAARAGAEVWERNDSSKVGKGYALDRAIQKLSSEPPEIVIFIDADCRLGEGVIDELASACVATSRPAQALYLMTAPENSSINYLVAEFAWLTKNYLRPLGLLVLGLPCQLMGTGMAFPWAHIKAADLASGELVEDLKLGLDMASAGHAPIFCPAARVSSVFPTSTEGSKTQRQRWEKGHLATIASSAPRLLGQALARGNADLLALTVDMAIPPLALLGMTLTCSLLISGVVAVAEGSSLALLVSTANLAGFTATVYLCWLKCGEKISPTRALPEIAAYAFGKLPLYRRIFTGRSSSKWIRTDRE